jgi:nitrite reductase/ring-hydroxylating ferredoxin subunit
VSQGQLRCPVHGMTFDLITGKTSDGCSQSLQFLSIVYEGNQMGVDL